MDIQDLKDAKKNYDDARLKTAKLAYQAVKYAIRKVEDIETSDINCNWDGSISVDNRLFLKEELEE